MGDLFQPTHLLVLAVILLILFGGKKLPELGKGLGEGLKGFKEGLKGITDPSPTTPTVQQTSAPAPPPISAPVESVSGHRDVDYVICSRCGGRFENPHGFNVVDYVCRSCLMRS
jgi:sec-independent protein translocase protein TatA